VGSYSSTRDYNAVVLADKGTRLATANGVGYIYEYEVAEFVNMVKTGVQPEPSEDLLFDVKLLHAIEEAYTTGKEVTL